MSTATAVSIITELQSKGYMVSAGGTRKITSGKSVVVVKEGAIYQKMLDDLFDPFVLIGHHVSLASARPKYRSSLTL